MAMDFSRKPSGFNTVTKSRQFDELKAALLARAERVCRHLYPAGRKEGPEWCVGSVNGEKGHSFKINLKTGIWKEFDGGPGGNDMIALWALAKGIKQGEAYDEAAAWLGWDTGKPKTAPIWLQPAKPVELPAAVEKDEGDLWWINVESKKWEYFDENGELWVTVRRWDNPKGGKRVRPWDPKERDEKWPEGLRPLFNLQGIKTSPDPVILGEGEKCADALNERGYCATTMPGGASAAKVIDWTPLRGRNVIRWADNDTAGAKWIEATRSCLEAVGVRTVRDVRLPVDKPNGWDCADASDKEIDDLIDAARNAAPNEIEKAPNTTPRRRLTILSVADADKQADLEYLVKGLIEPGSLSVWYGPPGSGKTFLVKHVAYAIAQGRSIFGRRVRQAPTLYIGLEGEGGIRNRVRALKLRFGSQGDFHFSVDSVSLLDRSNLNQVDIDAIVDAVNERGIRFVVIDTLNRAVGGAEENDSSTMGAFISACKAIAQRTGAHVAVVHHSSKAGTENGPRGHSSLEGAADAVVAVNGNGASVIRQAVTRKVKDGVDMSLSFTLEPVKLGTDADGDDIVSMVVSEADAPLIAPRKFSETQEALLKDIANILAAPDIKWEAARPHDPEGPTVQCVKRSFVVEKLIELGALPTIENGSVSGAGRNRLSTTLQRARQAGRLGSNGEWIWYLSG
jgi:AAA domain